MTNAKITAFGIAISLGVLCFHCQWLYTLGIESGACKSLEAWWIRPVVLSGFSGFLLGYIYSKNWKELFMALMLPSIVARQLSFFFLPNGPGNLWPFFFGADILLLAFIALVMYMANRLKSKNDKPNTIEPSS